MSCSDYRRYLNKNPVNFPDLEQSRTFIVLSDSKGFSLERIPKENPIEKKIVFNSRAGRTTHQVADVVSHNIHDYVKSYGKITLAIWTFTCDFTDKPGRNILLNDLTVDQVISECHRIIAICRPFGDKIKLVFLECPYYSISIWNQDKCRALRDDFTRDDQILEMKVDDLNDRLRGLNQQNGINAPRFSIDLKKYRKSNKVYQTQKISFGVLKDGVHPCEILSKYWLRRLINVIVAKECFD